MFINMKTTCGAFCHANIIEKYRTVGQLLSRFLLILKWHLTFTKCKKIKKTKIIKTKIA